MPTVETDSPAAHEPVPPQNCVRQAAGLRIILCAGLLVLTWLLPAAAQDTLNYPRLGSVERLSPQLDAILPADAVIEVIASGFDWSEGPVWVPEGTDGYLLFSDIPRNSVMRWDRGRGISLFLKPAGFTGQVDYGREPGSNGLYLDPQRRLVFCEHGDRRISVLTPGGGKMTIVDRYEGRRLNSPNDLVYSPTGHLYFTDPPYGLPKQQQDPSRELDFCGVFHLSPAGKLSLVTDQMTRPNGIGLSPDGKTLYVAQSDKDAPIVQSFPVSADGSVGAGQLFFDASPWAGKLKGMPDGMSVAQSGHLFVTGPGGVLILSAQGELLGRLLTGEATANCTFGGPEMNELFITADMYLCRVKTNVRGLTAYHD